MKRSANNLVVLVAIVLGGLFFGAAQAHAFDILYDADAINFTSSDAPASDAYANDWNMAQTFTASTTGQVENFFFAWTSENTSVTTTICIFNTANVGDLNVGTNLLGCGDGHAVASTDPLTTQGDWTFTDTITLTAGQSYTAVIKLYDAKQDGLASAVPMTSTGCTATENAISDYYGWRFSAAGDEDQWFGPGPGSGVGGNGCISFQITGTASGPGPGQDPAIEMYFPGVLTLNSSSTPFSDYNKHQVRLSGAWSPLANVLVSYDKDPAKLFTSSAYGLDSRMGSVAPLQQITDVLKTRSLSPGKWYIQAQYQEVSAFIATSSAVEWFYIATSSGIYPPGVSPTSSPVYNNTPGNLGNVYSNIFATSTESCAQYTLGIFSSTTVPAIMCMTRQTIYNVGEWLFVPPASVNEWFRNAIDFSDVVPFNIIMGVKDRIQVAGSFVVTASSTPSEATYSVKNPWNGQTTVLITSSTFRDALIGPNCNLSCANAAKADFQTYANAAIWLATSVAVIALFL